MARWESARLSDRHSADESTRGTGSNGKIGATPSVGTPNVTPRSANHCCASRRICGKLPAARSSVASSSAYGGRTTPSRSTHSSAARGNPKPTSLATPASVVIQGQYSPHPPHRHWSRCTRARSCACALETGSHTRIRGYSDGRDRRPHERSTASRGLRVSPRPRVAGHFCPPGRTAPRLGARAEQRRGGNVAAHQPPRVQRPVRQHLPAIRSRPGERAHPLRGRGRGGRRRRRGERDGVTGRGRRPAGLDASFHPRQPVLRIRHARATRRGGCSATRRRDGSACRRSSTGCTTTSPSSTAAPYPPPGPLTSISSVKVCAVTSRSSRSRSSAG